MSFLQLFPALGFLNISMSLQSAVSSIRALVLTVLPTEFISTIAASHDDDAIRAMKQHLAGHNAALDDVLGRAAADRVKGQFALRSKKKRL